LFLYLISTYVNIIWIWNRIRKRWMIRFRSRKRPYFNVKLIEFILSTIILSIKLLNCIIQSLLDVQIAVSTNFKDLNTISLWQKLCLAYLSLINIVYLIRQNLENKLLNNACIFNSLKPFISDLCEWVFISYIINK